MGPIKLPSAKAEVQMPEITACISSLEDGLASIAAFCAPEKEATSRAAVPIPSKMRPTMVKS